ncbi:MAG: cadmium-translocating P-type ATPase [Acinetobacter populi]|jgi:Cd2+/Zn2+-exporting ATPase|uniref:heavy metal translocating P-type ATPase n=1 Tax=Acinetobacter populi TaxID=1582270 RepID=UPI002354DB19|nr:heavy metal translocating P-type ATPase [Acinetobacter populi]MCH4248549.1 cadmium-translocating P-type ATPase [Acinetobacter populi]
MHKHHEYDKKQNRCCESEVDFKKISPYSKDVNVHEHHHELQQDSGVFKLFLPVLVSFVLLATLLILDHFVQTNCFNGMIRSIFYIVAYLPVGLPVLKEAVESIQNGDVFSEFFLMSIATLGAFVIEEYPEAVAVMLFYAVGEIFQTIAVSRAQNNIKALLDQRPDQVNRIQDGKVQTIPAVQVEIGDLLQLKVGEKVGLDGILRSKNGSFNTAALTGESKPDTKYQGDAVLAGMINLNTVTEIEVTTAYSDSKLSKILEMVQNATTQKAPTELFIRKFARIYTPIVVLLAIAISLLPYFFVENYQFSEWLYRALVFLVISCPCALVISIPLGYFGGIGAASRNGILVKGSSFLDTLANIQNVVMDKTGTMTEGVFKVQEVVFNRNIDQTHMLQMVSALEKLSTHPVATAIHQHVGELTLDFVLKEAEEIAGHGLKATVEDKILLVGNFKLMKKFDVDYDIDPASIIYTTIAVAYDNQFVGYITIADEIKADAQSAIDQLKALHVQTTMLSGDKNTVVQHVARQLGIDHAFGDLLPEDKVVKVKEIKARNETVAFVGDGVNDAPVVALSDVGIAMGGLGSDATIETADIVIQDDKPSKIPVAIHIGKQTKKIVWQNITLAFAVKAIVLILGAGGVATMWEAVFADVGVSLLAIMNAIRIQHMRF